MIEAVRVLLKIWFFLFYRVRVSGLESFPAEGGAVLCANHTYLKDLILLGYKLRRRVKWLAKVELFKNPLIGGFLSWLGAFPIRRGKSDRGAIKKTFEFLSKEEVVGIFPEGMRVRDSSNKPAVKRGFVVFALKAKVPIIPASIVYGRSPFRIGQVFSRIKVIFHEPYFLDFDKQYNSEELDVIGREIMNKIYSEI
ncbi:MAG: 1-acyl-sn-glycerol-3-phosphate acyltransferase [Oscillospiraceae bacterium]|nr:1-acyl-sn-glycerol-3-phosphate acyltransferase [Oscillospiraceae bacterium]